MNSPTLPQLVAATRALETAALGGRHELQALGHRLARLEQETAGLRALAGFLAARPARRETEPVAPVHRKAV